MHINEQKATSGNTKTLLVLLHGLGSNGDDLFSLVPFLARHLPDTHFFSPDAIEPYDMAPFGYQWFSLQDRDEQVLRSELERVSGKVQQMIKEKAESLGLGLEDVVLLGFSQGTMTSLYLALSSDVGYKAVIGFSGAFIKPSVVLQQKTPICLIHGIDDDVLAHDSMIKAEKILGELGINVETLSVPHLSHGIDMQGLEKAVSFLRML